MRVVTAGATSQSIYFTVTNSATGGKLTGLVFNTSGLTAYYARNQNTSVAITLATLAAANTAWSSGGFVAVDGTNMPGLYRLDVPDAAFVAGVASVVITIKGAANMVQADHDIQITVLDFQTATIATVTNLTNAPTAGDFTAAMKTSLNAATPAVTVSDKTGFSLTAAYDFAKGTVAMTESYAPNGTAPTAVQALYALHQDRMSFAIVSTSKTVRKLDGSTTAFVETLNSATAPTALNRA